MNEMTHRPTIDAPQLRTLLLTDLCDSTSLVERIGDVEAATLFRDHDRLVLDLQQRWRGRLIDRSDGLLLMFERPIDGLGFALDYVRSLEVMSAARGMELKARAGLHVGEVLTWRNTDEAVLAGAKPLEVEGLAKPMAARLMSMARPGQILLSSVAEPLAHRAARELGERGQQLLWKLHGRWRFKGVPESQQIYEVGEPGIAPLRMPPNTPKAWRDIPLWRRPASLVAEAAVVALFGVGIWFMTRPAPAIAFNQRDWVVVADLRNLTGQSVLDDSLEQAFRISLEQSRYVNVLSDLKARDTLARMQLKPDTALDRAIASEIALRDGARAVILPTVAEVGGKVRVSAEVIDPHTQTTVYAKTADGAGVDSTLASIDDVTASLRETLGETIESIQQDSAPLPQVTTGNLDALRAFALGQKAYGERLYDDAMRYYARATELDPKFALAWLGQVRVQVARMQAPKAVAPLRSAQALRARLPPREALYLDAWGARFDAPETATGKWMELARLYPDFGPGQSNAALWLLADNRFREALTFARVAAKLPQPDTVIDVDAQGRAHLALGEYAQATQAFDDAIARGNSGSLRRKLAVEAAQRQYDKAAVIESKLEADDRHAYQERLSMAVDRANWAQAKALAAKAGALAKGTGFDSRAFLLPGAVSDWLSGNRQSALTSVHKAAEGAFSALAQDYDADAESDAMLALLSALIAQRMGDRSLDARALAAVGKHQVASTTRVRELSTVLRAEGARRDGRPTDAIAMLLPLVTGRERYQTHVALMEAYTDAGQSGPALEQARWLQQHRGLAYAEIECGICVQALNVADSNLAALREAEALKQHGHASDGSEVTKHLAPAWTHAPRHSPTSG